VGILDYVGIDKNFTSLLLTLSNMLGADTFVDLVRSDATALVYPSQPSIDDTSNHPLSSL